jgi:hypothetical protein
MIPAQPSVAATEENSWTAYKENINGSAVVPTTGPYDEEDQFVGRHGFALEGFREIANPPS